MKQDKDYIITLDNDKKYVVVDSLNFQDKTYLYLAEYNDQTKYMVGELDNEDLVEVQDKKLLGKLLLEFAKNNN